MNDFEWMFDLINKLVDTSKLNNFLETKLRRIIMRGFQKEGDDKDKPFIPRSNN